MGLKETRGWNEYSVQDIVEDNLVAFWQEGLLDAGAYGEATYTGYSGLTNLQKVSDKTYEFFGPKLAWQKEELIQPSGFFVNGAWTDTGYTIDRELGIVKFDSSVTGTVTAEYSFPDVDVIGTSHKNWKIIKEEYQDKFNTIEDVAPSGIASVLKQNRVWMPTLVVDLIGTTSDPLQLGGGDIVRGTIGYHVFGDNSFKVKRIYDYLLAQQYTVIKLHDTETVDFSQTSYNDAGEEFWCKLSFNKGDGEVFLSPLGLNRAEFRQEFEIFRYPSRF